MGYPRGGPTHRFPKIVPGVGLQDHATGAVKFTLLKEEDTELRKSQIKVRIGITPLISPLSRYEKWFYLASQIRPFFII
jgi:hypothetical protein